GSLPPVRVLVETTSVGAADAEPMPAGRLHYHPGLLARHHPRAELLQPSDLRVDGVGLDVAMRPRLMTDTLDDDLDVPGRRHELNVAAVSVDVRGQRATQGRAPEPRLAQKVVGAAVDHDVAESAPVH